MMLSAAAVGTPITRTATRPARRRIGTEPLRWPLKKPYRLVCAWPVVQPEVENGRPESRQRLYGAKSLRSIPTWMMPLSNPAWNCSGGRRVSSYKVCHDAGSFTCQTSPRVRTAGALHGEIHASSGIPRGRRQGDQHRRQLATDFGHHRGGEGRGRRTEVGPEPRLRECL